MDSDLEKAKRLLHSQGLALAVVKEGRLLYMSRREGIADLLTCVEGMGEGLKEAALADKVVGKAVAMVARLAGIRSLYALVISQAGAKALEQGQVRVEYEQLVPLIVNRAGTGPCPMEALTLSLDDPTEAFQALKAFMARSKGP